MKTWAIAVIVLINCAGCEDSLTDSGWRYTVEFPPEFVPSGTDVAHEVSWTAGDGTVEVHMRRLIEERSRFTSLDDFADQIESGPEFTRPNFTRAPNGLQIAVDSIPNWTQIAVSDPEHTKYWEIILFGINAASEEGESIRLLRERAMGAILSGRSIRN